MRRPGLRRTARAIALAATRFSGAAWIARHTIQTNRVTVLAYHDPDPVTFERHLALLSKLYNVIPLGSLLEAMSLGDFSGLPPRSLLVTLDDGWASNASLLPAFERHRIRPTIFLTTSVVGTHRPFWWTRVTDADELERLKSLPTDSRLDALTAAGASPDDECAEREALSLDEIATMAPFVDFEAHTRTHPILPNGSADEAEGEIVGSVRDVERMTGVPPQAFAYPNGAHSPRDVDFVRLAGCRCAFGVEPGYVTASSDPYALDRIFVNERDGATGVIASASGVYTIVTRAVLRTFGVR